MSTYREQVPVGCASGRHPPNRVSEVTNNPLPCMCAGSIGIPTRLFRRSRLPQSKTLCNEHGSLSLSAVCCVVPFTFVSEVEHSLLRWHIVISWLARASIHLKGAHSAARYQQHARGMRRSTLSPQTRATNAMEGLRKRSMS